LRPSWQSLRGCPSQNADVLFHCPSSSGTLERPVNPVPGSGNNMLSSRLVRRPSAFLPIVMSLAALATIFIFIALHGTAPQPDEGAPAHIWQLLMACQLPIIAFFAVKWVPQSPRQALPVLGLQLAAALAAMAPVYLLHW
jgi:hypothetical protein